MPSPWGEALSILGSYAPQVERDVRGYYDRKRQREIEDEQREQQRKLFQSQMENQGLNRQAAEYRLNDAEYLQTGRDKAEKNFIDYIQDMKDSQRIPEMAAEGPTQQHDRLVRLEALGKKAPSEQLKDYDLISGASFSEPVRSHVNTVMGEEKAQKDAKRAVTLADLNAKNQMALKQFDSGLTSAENRRKEAFDLKMQREKLASDKAMQSMKQKTEKLTYDTGKPMAAESSKTLGQLQLGIEGASTFKDALEKGTANFWDVTLFGNFKNPEAKIAYNKMTEALGRMQSGGAITDDEKKNFNAILADKKSLATERGRNAIVSELGKFINRSNATGDRIYGNANWREFGQSGEASPRTYSGRSSTPTPQSQEEFDALPSGSTYIDPDDGKLYRKR